MTAVAEATQALVADAPAQFMAGKRAANLCLVRVPHRTGISPTGTDYTVSEGLQYQFEDGLLRLEPGQDMLDDGPLMLDEDGKPLRDERGRMTGQREFQDAITWMRSRPKYNQTGVAGGFVEVGREPGRVPAPSQELRDIAEASVTLDVAKLRDVLERERATHNRGLVLEQAEYALERAETAIAMQAEAPGADAGENA